MMSMRCFCVFVFLIFFIKAYFIGAHLNCLDLTSRGNRKYSDKGTRVVI